MKKTVCLLLCLLMLLLGGCGAGDETGKRTEDLRDAVARTEGLPTVTFYTTLSAEGAADHADPGLLAAFFGEGSEVPAVLANCRELAFFCASGMTLCEGWVAVCRSYSDAMAAEALFLSRKEMLSGVNFESEADLAAAGNAVCLRKGKTVWFFAMPDADGFLSGLKNAP